MTDEIELKVNGHRAYTISQAARLLGKSEPTIYSWMAKGVIKPLRLERRMTTFFTEEEIERVRRERE